LELTSTEKKLLSLFEENGYIKKESRIFPCVVYTAGKGEDEPSYWLILEEELSQKFIEQGGETAFVEKPEVIDF
jgi:hypothetical protein